jgi:hypothetical protein
MGFAGLRFGIIERLGVAAFLVGVAGVVASVTLPPAYQEALSHTWWGAFLFWGSLAVILASVLFFLCDLTLYVLRRRGVKLGTALISIAFVLGVAAAIVGLIGAFKIDQEKRIAKEEVISPSAEVSTSTVEAKSQEPKVIILVDCYYSQLPPHNVGT